MRRLLLNPRLSRLFAAKTESLVTFKVDGKTLQSSPGTLLIDAMRQAGIDVPTMCYHSDTKNSGGICRICVVEDVTRPGSMPVVSCRTPVAEGMEISTKSQKLLQLRHANTTLMFRTHPSTCLSCSSNTKCETQNQACKMNVHAGDGKGLMYEASYNPTVDKSTVINRKMDLCIGCDRCIQACSTQCNVYDWSNKDYHAVETFGKMRNSECIQCGQCINRCPTGALSETPEIEQVMSALADPEKHVVFQIAPAIRAAMGEEFGLKPGEKIIKNEMVTALKTLGKNVTVLDTDFGADLTIMEEASEFLERMCRKFAGKRYLSPEAEYATDLPMFTSCCPGWVTFMEKNYPDMLPHLSSCKSPMQMQSAMIKTYWAEKIKGINPKNIVNVAIMPCTAKKEEKDRADMRTAEFKWTDYILTTRETARIFKQAGLDPTKLPQTPFDKTMGISSGAGVIFGATGGVLEAALRTGYEIITGRAIPFKNLDIVPLRGMEGIREARIKFEHVKPEFAALEGFECRVAVAHQIINAKKVVEMVKAAKAKGEEPPWHLVEVMACPGGCIGGGGQPKPTSLEIRQARTRLIYKEDRNLPIRKSHDNPEIVEMYQNYLTHPLSETAHHLLHRGYTPFAAQHSATFAVDEARGIETVLDKYPKGKMEYLLPMVIDETDRKGYLSGASIVKLAAHVGVNPGRVDAIVSNYHYFPRTHTADTHMYLCMCHNCVMRGQDKNYRRMKELAEASKGSFSLHKMNWLGVCVNDAPAAMIKRAGTDYVEYLMGLTAETLEDKVKNLHAHLVKAPQNRIKTYPFTRLVPDFNHGSMLEPDNLLDSTMNSALSASGDEIIRRIMLAKLEGRGGAGFPTFRKWDSVRKAQADQKYIVCNADEGLPSTFKDWWILSNENARTRMISGMAVCAKTVGATKAYIYLRYEYRNLVPDIKQTIESVKARHPGLEGLNFEIRLGGGPYVAGEETAQFESIQGEAPLPRKNRPWNVFATMQGLFNRPTVINNVETYFSVPYILGHKEAEISKYGLPKMLGVTGDVRSPALLEYALHSAEHKPTLEKIIKELEAIDIVAAEVGGSTEPLVGRKDFTRNIGFGSGVLNAVGSLVLFNSTRSLKDVYVRKVEFMAEESCKQCVPCREGSKVMRDAIRSVGKKDGKVSKEMLTKVANATVATSICAHGRALGPLFSAAYDYVGSHQLTGE